MVLLEELEKRLDELEVSFTSAREAGDIEKAENLESEWDRVWAKLERGRRRLRRAGVIFTGPGQALATLGLVGFTTAFLLRLSADYEVIPPTFGFSETDKLAGTFGNHMEINKGFIGAYERNPLTTQSVLRFVLAHEFRHYLTYARHLPLSLPHGVKWRELRRKTQELEADEFAQYATGVGPTEVRQMARRLLRY